MLPDDRPHAVTRDDLSRVIADEAFGEVAGSGLGVGLEVEFLPVHVREGEPSGRVTLADTLHLLDAEAASGDVLQPRHPGVEAFEAGDGARLTFEPGGQIEISGTCHDSLDRALAETDALAGYLADRYHRSGIALTAVGVDVWHGTVGVEQQLTAPRYPAMADYLAARGPHGAVMMRHTCSIQVNLDPGTGAERRQRWDVANLVAPLLTASFANSPSRDAAGPRSRRAVAWRHLDPTRTGIPAAVVADRDADPVDALTQAALDADVLLFRRGGRAIAGERGYTLADWIDHGHAEHGRPDLDDLRYHLTTLFHEVRPRGWLEIRSLDTVPAALRPVPAVLLAGLLYDRRARDQVANALAPLRNRLPELLLRAALQGVADAELCAAAVETWSFALEGARRLPPGYVSEAAVQTAERFVDRYTMRGRAPADDLRELLQQGDGVALSWASEPLPTSAVVT